MNKFKAIYAKNNIYIDIPISFISLKNIFPERDYHTSTAILFVLFYFNLFLCGSQYFFTSHITLAKIPYKCSKRE